MSDLIERLREDAEMLKDGHQANLTEAWHTVAMKHAAKDAIEAADALEAKDKLIAELVEALQGALDKMEFTWQELDADGGLCRNVGDVPDGKLWKEIVRARSALSKAKE